MAPMPPLTRFGLREATSFDLENVLEAVPMPLVGLASDGSIRSWNRAAERMLGFRAEEAYGTPSSGLVRECDTSEWNTRITQACFDQLPQDFDADLVSKHEGL